LGGGGEEAERARAPAGPFPPRPTHLVSIAAAASALRPSPCPFLHLALAAALVTKKTGKPPRQPVLHWRCHPHVLAPGFTSGAAPPCCDALHLRQLHRGGLSPALSTRSTPAAAPPAATLLGASDVLHLRCRCSCSNRWCRERRSKREEWRAAAAGMWARGERTRTSDAVGDWVGFPPGTGFVSRY
jgi:hypothetical protein